MEKPKILYKYLSVEHADDILNRCLLYCGTIGDYRVGPKGDDKELSFWDIKDLIIGNDSNALETLNSYSRELGEKPYNPTEIMEIIDRIMMKKHMSCLSSSPDIKGMWEWCGNEKGICVPIKVKGLPYYKAIYGDSKTNFEDEIAKMMEIIFDSLGGKVRKSDIREIYNRMRLATYISICKKTTGWDYQEEYRMFVEDKNLIVINGKYYFNIKGRVKKPITYDDYLQSINKS